MWYYTEGLKLLYSKRPIVCVPSGEKNYTGQKKITQAPLVVLVTNMRYGHFSKSFKSPGLLFEGIPKIFMALPPFFFFIVLCSVISFNLIYKSDKNKICFTNRFGAFLFAYSHPFSHCEVDSGTPNIFQLFLSNFSPGIFTNVSPPTSCLWLGPANHTCTQFIIHNQDSYPYPLFL